MPRLVSTLTHGVLCISTLAFISGCAKLVPTKSETKTHAPTPGSWGEASSGQHKKISTGWLEEFDSPQMNKLVREALGKNPSLQASAARLRASYANTVNARSNQLPSVGLSAGGSRSYLANGDDAGIYNSNYNLGLNASWEMDLWGRLGDLSQASQFDYRASIEEFRGARLSLAANTARAWCNLIAADRQLRLAEDILNSFNKNVAIVERNYQAGVPGTRAIAVQLSRNNVAQAQRSLHSRLQARKVAARNLEQLLGRYPSASITATKALPRLKKLPPASIPAELLVRRPDLASAQLAVYQSAKIADAEQKNLLPSIRLTGSLRNNDGDLGNVFNPNFIASNIAASLTQTIYNGGKLKANAQAALERNKAAIYNFSDRAIAAFKEVENALADDRSLAEQEKFLLVEVRQAKLAVQSAEEDYSEGLDNSGILEILESQRRANNARAQLINLKNRRLQNRINLHLALGGDFFTAPPIVQKSAK